MEKEQLVKMLKESLEILELTCSSIRLTRPIIISALRGDVLTATNNLLTLVSNNLLAVSMLLKESVKEISGE
ncbi:MAG: hypothetical protein A3I88_00725 [Candidatus Portnoybacteria bacterium RIFCSPLOWO2_12_FULL_39_9]|uniref:Uncharacterized protein n=1 Tax=Candidatus Portnoybacteria bacterium RIFCSPHIGHO2_12_FULL_38_9 TaxID=1801997 RepID=A0A1G2FDZ8_9BACT|nr:MAG: hypothetical protein A2646_01135 [Candidatus Portnoybacteria bacterium RIFCSPHIGHO2_02_FULL_39_12]OGZ36286.1 MAG: hypothetical protein A3J64_02975 [Candidatus Portnoybacteria bacterium RIFCSPHIGHO2_12_FULL_38_9]OGZ39399.1 MAG: hypothetical protein A3F21_03345 [Candidatus Portnoybacteria bacterium RIFCSPLOWO2_01_FULL_38_39]OGZ40750.1 MAG: hypothetical protein A3I88_00725 [Candidatus Portnoybacteria bacterium RIFCSPLOWO2_12_FULL_39_9]